MKNQYFRSPQNSYWDVARTESSVYIHFQLSILKPTVIIVCIFFISQNPPEPFRDGKLATVCITGQNDDVFFRVNLLKNKRGVAQNDIWRLV